ncbi:MAG: cysteine desulfurase [Hydrogenothermaceae bacterium]|nr:cysteine desulfurase [Hydrogenothermaceae bacterium]
MIYFDNAATTVVFEEVLKNLNKYYTDYFANPSSIHREGQKARQLVEKSRFYISEVIGCSDEEIFFTSCATESNNTIIFGVAERFPNKNKIVVSPVEHKSVLMPLKQLVKRGFKVEFLKVDKDGKVDIDYLKNVIDEKTALVAVLHGNNETGVLQDIESIGKICREKEVLFFTDVVQSFLKEEINIEYIDFLSISGHKFNAPKGIGILYKRKDIDIPPLIYGGGQEKGLRSGTENVQLIGAISDAVRIWKQNSPEFIKKLKEIRKRFEALIKERIPQIHIVGEKVERLPHISNIIFQKVDAQSLIMALDSEGICVSSGSACSSGTPTPSHVLLSMGYSEKEALSSVRFSFGVYNTLEEVDFATEKIREIYLQLSTFF